MWMSARTADLLPLQRGPTSSGVGHDTVELFDAEHAVARVSDGCRRRGEINPERAASRTNQQGGCHDAVEHRAAMHRERVASMAARIEHRQRAVRERCGRVGPDHERERGDPAVHEEDDQQHADGEIAVGLDPEVEGVGRGREVDAEPVGGAGWGRRSRERRGTA